MLVYKFDMMFTIIITVVQEVLGWCCFQSVRFWLVGMMMIYCAYLMHFFVVVWF